MAGLRIPFFDRTNLGQTAEIATTRATRGGALIMNA